MNHRGAGISLLAIAAALSIGRDLAAAIFYPANAGEYSAVRFAQWRDYVGSAPTYGAQAAIHGTLEPVLLPQVGTIPRN